MIERFIDLTALRSLLPYAVSLVVGALIGVEREVKKQSAPDICLGGIRTFALIALLGTLSEALGVLQYGLLALFGLIIAHRLTYKGSDLTSEVSALLTFLLGAICFEGFYFEAAVVAVLVFTLLTFKKQLHEFAKHLTLNDLIAVVKFAVVTVIVYPLLPSKPIYGVSLKSVWTMVIIISSIDFVGYVLTKFAGKKGVLIAGLIGGLVSSTAVTLTFAPLSRKNPDLIYEYASGIIGASAIMFPRMSLLAAIVNPSFASFLLVPSLIAFSFGVLFAYKLARKKSEKATVNINNPFELSTAIKFGAFYAVVLFASSWALSRFGDAGLYAVAAISGLSDVDPLTLSVAKLFSAGQVALVPAVIAVLISAAVNTAFKWFLSLAIGSWRLFVSVSSGFVSLLLGELVGVFVLKFSFSELESVVNGKLETLGAGTARARYIISRSVRDGCSYYGQAQGAVRAFFKGG